MMNNELRPYEIIKKSEIPWIIDLPSHWDVERAKSVFRKVNRPVRECDEVVTCFRDGVVTLRKNRRTTGFTESIKEIGYQGIRKGDLVIHVMDAFAGAIGVSDSDGKATPVYSVCLPKIDLNNYYYAYVVREMAKTGFIQSLYRGIRERSSDFRFEVFGNQYLPIPPRPEQDQIVKYLDHQLFKINKFIKAKKKLIAVLKEQKQAIINEAVTKGLEPSVKMKPSGVEWLGDVPEHWEVVRIKNIKDRKKNAFVDGPFGSNLKSEHFIQNGYAYVIESNFATRGKLDLQGLKTITRDHFYTINRSEVRTGDIVIAKIGAYFGYSNILPFIDKPAVVSGNSLKLSIDQLKCDVRFVNYQLKAIKNMGILDLEVKSTAQPALSLSYLNTVTMVLPPKKEQENIAEQIIKRNEMIDSSIVAIENEITLIAEYKNSLTTDVVTGKLDVRHVLIDETEEMGQDDFELDEDSIDTEEIIEDEEGDE